MTNLSDNSKANLHRSANCRTGSLRSFGFTLFELLVTVTIIGILAAAVVPLMRTTDANRLQAAATILASELEAARNLAVTNQSQYRLTFTPGTNEYYLEHSGTNTALNVLPASPFAKSNAAGTRQTSEFASATGNSVNVLGLERGGAFTVTDFNIEFTSLGSTSNSAAPTLWLSSGLGSEQRFISVSVNPTTGLVDVGDFTARNPNSIPAAKSFPSGVPSR